jgi:hypothetical protein
MHEQHAISEVKVVIIEMGMHVHNFIECKNIVDDTRFTCTTDGYEIAV